VMIGRRPGEVAEPPTSPAEVAPPPTPAPASPPDPPASIVPGEGSFAERLDAVRALVARLDRVEIEHARQMVANRIDALEGVKAELGALARLRHRLLDR